MRCPSAGAFRRYRNRSAARSGLTMLARTDDKLDLMLPVEIMSREIDGRLLLACMCADETRRVLIGQHDTLQRVAERSRGGLYAGKNVFKEVFPRTDLARYETLRENDHTLIHL